MCKCLKDLYLYLNIHLKWYLWFIWIETSQNGCFAAKTSWQSQRLYTDILLVNDSWSLLYKSVTWLEQSWLVSIISFITIFNPKSVNGLTKCFRSMKHDWFQPMIDQLFNPITSDMTLLLRTNTAIHQQKMFFFIENIVFVRDSTVF